MRRETGGGGGRLLCTAQAARAPDVLRELLFHIEAPSFVHCSQFDAFLIAMRCRVLKCFNYANYL